MAEVHHFAYGWFTPVGAYLVAFLGSLLGLVCVVHGRARTSPSQRARWLVLASAAIGGASWLMHVTAILGFDVPGSPVRYDPVLTIGSMLIAVAGVGVGVFIVGWTAPAGADSDQHHRRESARWGRFRPASAGRRSVTRVLLGGLFTGIGGVAMHYTAMAGMHLAGTVSYDSGLVAASVVIAVTAATTALWFAVTIRGWWPIVAAALIMGVAMSGMHYTAMAARHVRLRDTGEGVVTGLSPLLLIVPITLLTSVALIGMALTALQAIAEDEVAGTPRRTQPGHAPRHVRQPGF